MTVDTRPVRRERDGNPRGSVEPLPGRCGAKLISGRFCLRYPIKGAKRCDTHGSGSPQSRAKAREVVLKAKVNGRLQELGWEPVVDPVARYAELAGETLAFKDLARERINELNSWEFVGGGEAFDALDVHAAVKVYQWGLEQSEKILGRMSALGLTADILREALHLETQRPTSEQVEKLAAVLNRVLSDSRVSVSGDARGVVVDAMKAEGLG